MSKPSMALLTAWVLPLERDPNPSPDPNPDPNPNPNPDPNPDPNPSPDPNQVRRASCARLYPSVSYLYSTSSRNEPRRRGT